MTADASNEHQRRKDDHIALAGQQQLAPVARNDFDEVEFVHHALDGIDEESLGRRERPAGQRH